MLYDVVKINKELYNDLMTFMEIWNQFVYNMDADSCTIVSKRLNKENVLLKEIKNEIGDKTTKLDNISVFVRKYEVGGGVITYKNG